MIDREDVKENVGLLVTCVLIVLAVIVGGALATFALCGPLLIAGWTNQLGWLWLYLLSPVIGGGILFGALKWDEHM